MADEKDRFGERLRDAKKAREDEWARKQDELLLAKLRQKQGAEVHCPTCNERLVARAEGGLAIMVCPYGHGGWLDQDALQSLTKR